MCQQNDPFSAGFITCFWSIERPSISHLNSCHVTGLHSESLRGHWNLPFSRRLYRRTNPSPSQRSAFRRSHFLPQNRNSAGWKGSSMNCCWTIAARPSMDLRISVYPVATYISFAILMSPNTWLSARAALPPLSDGWHHPAPQWSQKAVLL